VSSFRFVLLGKVIAEYVPSFIEYPLMQARGSFNVSDLKAKIEQAQAAAHASSD
jgi:hypothetical protein